MAPPWRRSKPPSHPPPFDALLDAILKKPPATTGGFFAPGIRLTTANASGIIVAVNPASLSELAVGAAHDLGFDLVGVAPAGPAPDLMRFEQWLAAGFHGEMAYLSRRLAERADVRAWFPPARSLILVGLSYFREATPAALRNDPSRGQIAAYAWSDDYHEALKPLLFQLDAAICTASGRVTHGRVFVDSGPVLERSWAQSAGLGFIGKNTCLIAPERGSLLFLAGLAVPEEMAERRPAASQQGTCGRCTRCLDVCPTGALPEAYQLDARRCISYLTIELKGAIPRELRPLMGNWIFGCDLCQDVCPWNRRFARPAQRAVLQTRPEMIAPPLLDLLALDEDGFRKRFRNSPVLRARRRGLLRNVCVALGNWGDPTCIEPLTHALADAEPLIRQHAAWALGRINDSAARAALGWRLSVETDPAVREEISFSGNHEQ